MTPLLNRHRYIGLALLVGAVTLLVVLVLVRKGAEQELPDSVSDLDDSLSKSSLSTDVADSDVTVPASPGADPEISCEELTESLFGTQLSSEQASAKMAADTAAFVEVLSASSTSEHLHIAAHFESDSSEKLQLIERALSINPWEPMLSCGAVQVCLDVTPALECPLREWGQRLVDVDSDNSEAWAMVAANEFSSGRTDVALEALKRASAASESNMYWTDYIGAIERSLAATTNDEFPTRAVTSMSRAPLPSYGHVLEMCRAAASLTDEWGATCIRYGRLLASQGRTEFGFAIGRAVERVVYEGLGDTDTVAFLKAKALIERKERVATGVEYSPAFDVLMLSTPEGFHSYLEAIRTKGEATALRESHR
ncbi:hypothetical protein R0137_06390 [Congregibacter brevis]|uniref:Uncharacterized protein n=1 Tax=Congregibacter brevis TaxID=3081201 RepID=A0ABZ0IIR0_9GAMM|nr:hypothetical protein R0137_06390 [Congregibacter sp. IMCC45268]